MRHFHQQPGRRASSERPKRLTPSVSQDKQDVCAPPCGTSQELRTQTKMFGSAAGALCRGPVCRGKRKGETLRQAEDDEMGVGSCPRPLRHCEEEMDIMQQEHLHQPVAHSSKHALTRADRRWFTQRAHAAQLNRNSSFVSVPGNQNMIRICNSC